MSFPTIPTATEIKDRIISDIETALNQTTPAMPKAFNRVLAGALAGVIVLLYQTVYYTYKAIFPSTADEVALKLLGAIVDIDMLPAEFAVLSVNIPGIDGTAVDTTVQFLGANSVVYKVTIGATVSGGVATCEITAQESGEIGNLSDGDSLSIVSPVVGLDGTATVVSTVTSGDDAESLDSYRTRVIAAYRKRKTGGSPADYEEWGLETPNFVWVSPIDQTSLPGDVLVYGKVDNQTDGIPSGSQLTELESYLKSSDPTNTTIRDRHPIGPPLDVQAISRVLFDITISIQNGTTEIESDVDDAVIQYVENQEPYNEAISLIRSDTISEGGISSAGNDVANEAGATITSVILTQTSTSTVIPSYQLFGGEWGKVNSITYVDVV